MSTTTPPIDVKPSTTAESTTVPPKKCSHGYQLLWETGFCYKVHYPTPKVNRDQAEKTCESENAHLASIHSKEENTLLAELSRKSGGMYPESSYVHRLLEEDEVLIGLFFKDGKWQWSDGSPLDYTYWGWGEPNLMEVEWTTTLMTSKIFHYNPDGQLWNNVQNISLQRAFICKKMPM